MDCEPEANSTLLENGTVRLYSVGAKIIRIHSSKTFQESIPQRLFKSFKNENFFKKTNKPLLPLKFFSIYLNPNSALVKVTNLCNL